MKPSKTLLLVLLAGGVAASPAFAQGFVSGSDGSYGPIDITKDTTLEMPLNGIFNCTTIKVGSGFTLKFNRNPLNTAVVLLATGDVLINGTIDVSGANSNPAIPDGGRGGPGGFDGGKPGFTAVPPGYGFGPGGGRPGTSESAYYSKASAGSGSYGSVAPISGSNGSTNRGVVYGSPLLIPILGGSGGGGTVGSPGRGGGVGGGAILIASTTKIEVQNPGRIIAWGGGPNAGRIDTDGDYNFPNAGSGGAIRLVAPVIAGNGTVSVIGGNGNVYAGHGRIRVDSIQRTGLQFAFFPSGNTSVGSTMLVFPKPTPSLDIVSAAGTAIAEGSGPVIVQLPYNSPTAQVIKVQAKDFFSQVPIRVVLTPDNGAQTYFDAVIDNRTDNPASTEVNVTMPVNVQVTVHVWTL